MVTITVPSILLPGMIVRPFPRVPVPVVGWQVPIWHPAIHVVTACSTVSGVMISTVAGTFRAGGPVAAMSGL